MLINATIVKDIYHKDDFYVFGAKTDNKNIELNKYGTFTLTGNLGYLAVGCSYELDVAPTITKYGTSYIVNDCPSLSKLDYKNMSHDETYTFLSAVTSSSLAKVLADGCPNCVQLFMEERENEINTKILRGIKAIRLKEIARNARAKFKVYEMYAAFKNYNITFSEARELLSKYGSVESAKDKVKNNPYEIFINILNRSFYSADLSICTIEPSWKDKDVRGEYLAIYLLKENEIGGSTKIDARELAAKFNETAPQLTNKLPNILSNSEKIHFDTTTLDVALIDTYLQEYFIAENLLNRINIKPWIIESNVEQYRHQADGDLTDEQISALDNACKYNVSILSGAGGCGKSFTVNSIIKLLDDNNLTYTLLTPTGTSAKVLANYTNRSAYTIHKQLVGDGGVVTDVLIVDEFSFVGVELMSTLLKKTAMQTKIIIVADEYQLGSISCGNVLKNMLDSNKFPITRLTKVFRYGKGGISTIATDIRNGDYIHNEKYSGFSDYKLLQLEENPLEQIIKCYDYLLTKYDRSDIIILSPFNVRSCGANEINEAIQKKYNQNPLSYKNGKNEYRVDDLVINTKNWYGATTWLNDEPYPLDELDIMNGEIGIIIDIINDNIICRFDDKTICYAPEEISRLKLAYAMTVHKSQGHQYKAVINVFSPLHSDFINRGLLYVAASRAQKELIQITNESILNKGIVDLQLTKRNTFLYDLLMKGVETNV